MPGIALASLFSDWSHEIATAVLPASWVLSAWLRLALSASDLLRSARYAASSPFPLLLRLAAATALISVASAFQERYP